MPASRSHRCFVIAPIGPPDSDIRRKSDALLNLLIRPALDRAGLSCIRADEIDMPGIITNQIVRFLYESILVIADLAGPNPNVMYELAIRHSTGKPVVQIAPKGQSLPFDIANLRTVFYDLSDLRGMETAKAQLERHVASVVRGGERCESPIDAGLRTGEIDDAQTKNLIRLHQNSSAYCIYSIIDSTLSQMEKYPSSYNAEHFVAAVTGALLESRSLCSGFRSQRLGDIYGWLTRSFSIEELREAVVRGQKTILERPDFDPNLKRIKLLEYIAAIQQIVRGRLEATFGTD